MARHPDPDGRRVCEPSRMQRPAIDADNQIRLQHHGQHDIGRAGTELAQMSHSCRRQTWDAIVPIEQNQGAITAVDEFFVKRFDGRVWQAFPFLRGVATGVEQDNRTGKSFEPTFDRGDCVGGKIRSDIDSLSNELVP